jgi:Uma2 family endonuclease
MERMGVPARKRDETFNYGQYRSWPDDERWELIDGVAWAMAAPGSRHQILAVRLTAWLYNWFQGKPCQVFPAPFDVLLPEAGEADDEVPTVVQPDLSVFCDRSRIREANARGAPDLALEILSPSTARKDLNEKLRLFERHGVREYWIVDGGNRSVQVFRLGPRPGQSGRKVFDEGELLVNRGVIGSGIFPGLSVNLEELFAD